MDWESIPEKFRENIKRKYVVVQRGLEGWKKIRLGEVVKSNCKSIDSGYPHETIQYLDTGSITEGKMESLQIYKLSEAPTRARRLVKDNDIVYSTVRPIQRHYGFVKNVPANFVVSTGFSVIETIKTEAEPLFIYHLLTSKNIIEEFDSIAEGATSAYPSLKPSDIENLEILLPPLSEQKAIAEVLSSLDDKIDLLHRQNKTLEDMAQALFRKWFVEDADEGWEVGKLGDVIELCYGKGLRKSERTGKGFPVVGSSGITDYHFDYLVKGPGIVIGRKGTLGETTYLWSNFYPIDTTYFVLPKSQSNGLYFEYFLLKKIDFANMNTDSAVPGLNRNIALRTEITIPKESERHKFNKEIEPSFNKIFFNQSQIKTLKKLRGTLLPALMNGKVRLKNKTPKNENPLVTLSSSKASRDHRQNIRTTIFHDLEKTILSMIPSSVLQGIAVRTGLTTVTSLDLERLRLDTESAIADMVRPATAASFALERLRLDAESAIADMVRPATAASFALERLGLDAKSAIADMVRPATAASFALERLGLDAKSAIADMVRPATAVSFALERLRLDAESAIADKVRPAKAAFFALERLGLDAASAIADKVRPATAAFFALERLRLDAESAIADKVRPAKAAFFALERLGLDAASAIADKVRPAKAAFFALERLGLDTASSATLLESLMATRENFSSILLQRQSIDTLNFRFNIDHSSVTENFEYPLPDDSSVNENKDILSSISKLDIDANRLLIIKQDFEQIPETIYVPPLFLIITYCKILENLLAGLKCRHPELFNQEESTSGKQSLYLLGDAAYTAGLLHYDGKIYLDLLRNFRNHVHPDMQLQNSNFYPDMSTAQICKSCFKLIIKQLIKNHNDKWQ